MDHNQVEIQISSWQCWNRRKKMRCLYSYVLKLTVYLKYSTLFYTDKRTGIWRWFEQKTITKRNIYVYFIDLGNQEIWYVNKTILKFLNNCISKYKWKGRVSVSKCIQLIPQMDLHTKMREDIVYYLRMEMQIVDWFALEIDSYKWHQNIKYNRSIVRVSYPLKHLWFNLYQKDISIKYIY